MEGKSMKQLRLDAGLRAEDVASHVGVAHSSVRNWEQGRTEPKLKVSQVAKLCQLYHCTIEDLDKAVILSAKSNGSAA